MTQKELADAIGVSRPLVAQIERGTRALTIVLGLEIANVLKCDLDYIIYGNDKKEKNEESENENDN